MFDNQSDCIEIRREGECAAKLREDYYSFAEDSQGPKPGWKEKREQMENSILK